MTTRRALIEGGSWYFNLQVQCDSRLRCTCDDLGSTALTADGASGAKLSELRYKPWGEVRYVWGATMTGYRYTGQRMEGTGLYDYGGGTRWYDSSLGRFAQAALDLAPSGARDLDFETNLAILNLLLAWDPVNATPLPATLTPIPTVTGTITGTQTILPTEILTPSATQSGQGFIVYPCRLHPAG